VAVTSICPIVVFVFPRRTKTYMVSILYLKLRAAGPIPAAHVYIVNLLLRDACTSVGRAHSREWRNAALRLKLRVIEVEELTFGQRNLGPRMCLQLLGNRRKFVESPIVPRHSKTHVIIKRCSEGFLYMYLAARATCCKSKEGDNPRSHR